VHEGAERIRGKCEGVLKRHPRALKKLLPVSRVRKVLLVGVRHGLGARLAISKGGALLACQEPLLDFKFRVHIDGGRCL